MTTAYLSEIIGNPIYSVNSEKIGTLSDIVIASIDRKIPHVRGLLLSRGLRKTPTFIPDHDISQMNEHKIHLSTGVVDLTPFERKNDEVLLVGEVLDKQIVDIDDRRLTRINDLKISQERGFWILSGVDVGPAALFYRLGVPFFKVFFKRNLIEWEDVQFLGGNLPVKIKLQFKNLESLHPVDIARIILEGPGYKRGSRVITSLKDHIAADIIEQLSPTLQRKLIEEIPFEELIDIIAHMEPDRAADLLITLNSALTKKILDHLSEKQTKTLKTLLTYPEYTAGAYMNTEYLCVPAQNTVADTLVYMRELLKRPEFSLYVYIVESDTKNHLVGVLSADELFSADPRSRISAIMVKHPIATSPAEHIREVLKTMHHYSLSAIPVVGKENNMLGIVTYQDAATVYLPKSWKHRTKNIFY